MYKIDTVELRKCMIDSNVDSVSDLARKAGMTRNSIENILKGNTLPNLVTMYAIARVLNATPERLGRIFFAKSVE